VHATSEEEFATVIQVMLDDVPDNPLARDWAISSLKDLLEISGCPACKTLLDQAPGDL
jgi:hypothetical protein